MSFADRDQKKDEGHQPHPHYQANRESLSRLMSKVVWLYPDENWSKTTGFSNPVRWEMQGIGPRGKVYDPIQEKHVYTERESTCVIFKYPTIHANQLFPKGPGIYRHCTNGEQWMDVLKAPRGCTVITFHQTNRKSDKFRGFCEDLAAILNYIGSKGYLEHRIKNADGSYKGARDPDDKWGAFERHVGKPIYSRT